MSRPVGVTASAVVAIVGSIFALLVMATSVASLLMGATKPQSPNSAQFVVGSAALFAAFAGFGIWTSVGLFRLRSWARVSILVFAGFLAAMSIFSLLISIVAPIPSNYPADALRIFHRVITVMFGIPLAIAVWWLIQFNTQSTKAAFASPVTALALQRPMSITVIAWALIVGGASCLILIPTSMPLVLFGASFNGWIARVIYAIFAALSLYLGKGLLDLRERARVFAIGWCGFWFVHAGLVTLVPPLRQRMFELRRELEQNQPTPNQIPFDQGMFMNVMFGFTAILVASAIWFLLRNRTAFVRAENKPT